MKDINEANLQGVMNVEGAEKVFKIVKSSFFYFYPSCIFSWKLQNKDISAGNSIS